MKSTVRTAVAGKLAADIERDSALAVKNEVLLDTSAELITAGAAVDAAEHSKAAAVAAAQAERAAAAAAAEPAQLPVRSMVSLWEKRTY